MTVTCITDPSPIPNTNMYSETSSQLVRALHFLLAHGGAAPFTLAPLARHFDPTDPREAEAVAEHADLVAT